MQRQASSRYRVVGFFLAALGGFSIATFPSIVTAQQQDPAIQLRQELQQRQRQEELQTAPALPAMTSQPDLTARPEELAEPDPVLHSPAIKVNAHGLLADDRIRSLVGPYEGLDLGRQRIALLLRQLNAALVTQGLVTTRSTVREVDAAANVLEIEVLPGRVGAYVTGDRPLDGRVQNAFPDEPGDVLVLQDIEQGVQQIQRLRRYQAEVRILPGQSPNTSLVDLMLTESKPWWLQFALDNEGARQTGRARGRATITLENTLGLLESVGMTYLRSARSEVGVASLAIPFGYNTWSASYAASRYREDLPAGLSERGGSYTATLAWNRVLHLSAAGRDMAEVGLTSNDSWRRVEDIPLTPERLSVVKASLIRLRQGNGWRAWGEADLSRGLPWIGQRASRTTRT